MNLAKAFFSRWTNLPSVKRVAKTPLEEPTAGKGYSTNFLVLEAQLSGVPFISTVHCPTTFMLAADVVDGLNIHFKGNDLYGHFYLFYSCRLHQGCLF